MMTSCFLSCTWTDVELKRSSGGKQHMFLTHALPQRRVQSGRNAASSGWKVRNSGCTVQRFTPNLLSTSVMLIRSSEHSSALRPDGQWTCTEATTHVSESCHTWSSCTANTPGTRPISTVSSSMHRPDGDAWSRSNTWRQSSGTTTAIRTSTVSMENPGSRYTITSQLHWNLTQRRWRSPFSRTREEPRRLWNTAVMVLIHLLTSHRWPAVKNTRP